VKHEYDIETLDLPDLGEGCKEKLVICSITVCDGRFYFNGSFDELSPITLLSFVAIHDAISGESSGKEGLMSLLFFFFFTSSFSFFVPKIKKNLKRYPLILGGWGARSP
jgi:hypothetical protein